MPSGSWMYWHKKGDNKHNNKQAIITLLISSVHLIDLILTTDLTLVPLPVLSAVQTVG